jgi:hypothetical protein
VTQGEEGDLFCLIISVSDNISLSLFLSFSLCPCKGGDEATDLNGQIVGRGPDSQKSFI